MKQIYLSFLLAFMCLNLSSAQTYDHVYSKIIGVYQQASWVSGQEYVIENFSNFSKCHTNINVNYTFDLEAGRNGTIKMYAVNGSGEYLVNTIVLGASPVSGTITIPTGLLQIDQFLIKWVIGNTNSSNFIFENFIFTASSPLASMPAAPLVNDVYYSIGASASPLSATGSNIKWYTSSTGGMPILTAPTPNTSSTGVTTYWVTQANASGCESARTEIVVTVSIPATYLNFDGVDDYVYVENNPITLDTESLTMQAWINTASIPTTQKAILQRGQDGYGGWNLQLGLQSTGNVWFTSCCGSGGSIQSTTVLMPNQWYHVTAIYENGPTGSLKLYINGVLESTSATLVNPSLRTSTRNLVIGGGNNGSEFFNGSIDEVRVWNTVLSAVDITNSMNCELLGTEPGLKAYFKFNQGFDATNNTAETALTNTVSGGANGVFSGLALTGTTSNFLAGSPVTTGSIVPSNATVTTPVVYNQGATASALTATTGTNGSGLLWYTAALGGMGATTAPTPSTATPGNTSYWVSSTNANGCESTRTEIVVRVNAPATHLNFDGVDDIVTLPISVSGTASGSVEMWMQPTSLTSVTLFQRQHDFVNTHTTIDMGLNVNGSGGSIPGKIYFHLKNGIPNLSSTTILTVGQWYHITATWNGTSASLYINGVLEQTLSGAYSGLVSTGGYLNLGGFNGGSKFQGNMDELRVWNRALSITEIVNNLNCELPSPSTQVGLTAYYQFNQGFDAANNSTITTLIDASPSVNNGTLTNFTLTSSTSNWLSGSTIVTGSNCTPLSIGSFEVNSKLKMYPNPSSNFVTIEVTSLTNAKLQVLDVTGKVLMNESLNNTTNSVSVQQLPTGLYFFKITSNEGTATSKIIKN